jgi:hypothetical protein
MPRNFAWNPPPPGEAEDEGNDAASEEEEDYGSNWQMVGVREKQISIPFSISLTLCGATHSLPFPPNRNGLSGTPRVL